MKTNILQVYTSMKIKYNHKVKKKIKHKLLGMLIYLKFWKRSMHIDILKTQKSGYYRGIIIIESRERRKAQAGDIHGTVTIW